MRKKGCARKAQHTQLQTRLRLDAEVGYPLPEGVFGRPWCGVGAPLKWEVLKDKCGSRQMAGRTYHLGASPAMPGHDALAVEDILNGVLRVIFFDNRTWWDALRDRKRGHDVRFDVLIMSRAAGENEVWGDSSFELADAFEGAFALLG